MVYHLLNARVMRLTVLNNGVKHTSPREKSRESS